MKKRDRVLEALSHPGGGFLPGRHQDITKGGAMNAWEVEYEVVFSEGLLRPAEGGWLVVDCLFRDTAGKKATEIIRQCYISEHNDPGEFLVWITKCVKV